MMAKMIKECWCIHASARLTALRVKKSLTKLMDGIQKPKEDLSLNCEIITDKNIYMDTLTYSSTNTNLTNLTTI